MLVTLRVLAQSSTAAGLPRSGVMSVRSWRSESEAGQSAGGVAGVVAAGDGDAWVAIGSTGGGADAYSGGRSLAAGRPAARRGWSRQPEAVSVSENDQRPGLHVPRPWSTAWYCNLGNRAIDFLLANCCFACHSMNVAY